MGYKDNPFYVLGASITDNRRKIISMCEERSLYNNPAICDNARNILITPQKRIRAEIRWFPDCNDAELESIYNYLDNVSNGAKEPESLSGLSTLTQMNICCFAFRENTSKGVQVIKREVLKISKLYESLNAEEIQTLINEKRTVSGFPQIERLTDITSNIAEMRLEIKKLISEKIQKLSEESYIKLATEISESYSSRRNKGQAVLEDVISEYQLYITDKLEGKASSIIRVAEFISQSANKINVDFAIQDVLNALYDWDKMAQPMQLSALTKGGKHSESERMFGKMRNLSIDLHNKYELSEQALEINEAMQKVFAEMPENLDQLKEDHKTLSDIVESNKIDPIIEASMSKVLDMLDDIKDHPETATISKIDEILEEVKSLNIRVRQLPTEESIEIRKTLSDLLRAVSMYLHNEKGETEKALHIIKTALPFFSDITELRLQLTEDMNTLQNLYDTQEKNRRIDEKFELLKNQIEGIKTSSSTVRYNLRSALISTTRELDEMVKGCYTGDDLQKAREAIGFMVRSAAIDLYNKFGDSNSASDIISSLSYIFQDIPNLKSRLDVDSRSLQNVPRNTSPTTSVTGNKYNASDRNVPHVYTPVSNPPKKSNSGCLIRIVILAIILCVVFWNDIWTGLFPSTKTGSSSSPKQTYSTPRQTYSTPRPTVKPTSSPRAAAGVQRPASGHIFYNRYADNHCELDITNNFENDIYCKLVDMNGNEVKIFFVRTKTTAKIPMPVGDYELKFATGSTWYGEQKLFGIGTTSYSKDKEPYRFAYGDIWTVTYYSAYNSGSSDFNTIYASDF